MANDSFTYAPPNASSDLSDLLFGLPNQYTGGLYTNIWLMGLFAMVFIGGLKATGRADNAAIFASFATFITTFMLTILGFAGENQIIGVTVVFIGSMAVKYVGSR